MIKEKGPVYEIMQDPKGLENKQSQSSVTDAPDPLGERTPEWYLSYVRYIIGFYNTYTPNIDTFYTQQKTSGSMQADGPIANDYYQPPVDRMLLELSYFTGDQPNLANAWLAKDVSNKNSTAFWTSTLQLSRELLSRRTN